MSNEIKTYSCSDDILDEIFNKKYKILNLIDKGSFSQVFEIVNLKNNLNYVVKIMLIDNDLNTRETIYDEIKILSKLNSPYIIKLYEVFFSEQRFFLIMEKADGNLRDLLKKFSFINDKIASKIFNKILLGVKYLHDSNIVHRDIKFQNILYITENKSIDYNNQEEFINHIQIKIIDFGLSAEIIHPQNKNYFIFKKNISYLKKRDTQLGDLWGTKEYMAPEIYFHKYGRQIDIWSLGCVLFEILTGSVAFRTREIKLHLFYKIIFGIKRTFEYNTNYINLSADVKKFIKKMIKISPVKRYDIDECLKDNWICQYNK